MNDDALFFAIFAAASSTDSTAEIRSWAQMILTAGAVLGAAIVAARAQIRNRRETARDSASTPTPPTTAEVWARMDAFETVMRAAVGLLEEVVEQMPPGFSPKLSRRHVAVLHEHGYLPDRLQVPQ